MQKEILRCLSGVFTAIILALPARAEVPVAVELVLAVDTSISVNSGEYQLQMQGIARAFRSADIIDLIDQQPGGVAVTLVQWSLGSQNRQSVEWRHLTDPASVFEFARAVETAPRLGAGRGTAIGDALWYSARLIESNGYAGATRKIDISGDSRSNSGGSPAAARDAAVLSGITINGLVIEGGDRNLAAYYQHLVIGGEDAFVISVAHPHDFAHAMHRKLARELGPVAALR